MAARKAPTYPKALKVGPVWYDVKMVAKKDWHDAAAVGTCDRESREIRILKDQSPDDVLWTFWHEVLHTWWADRVDTTALQALILHAERAAVYANLEEIGVEGLSVAFLQAFADNPELLPLLAEYIKTHNGKGDRDA